MGGSVQGTWGNCGFLAAERPLPEDRTAAMEAFPGR
jgi:hypothetical protein